jgi:hypothetical protein
MAWRTGACAQAGALEDAIDIAGCTPELVQDIRTVANEAAGGDHEAVSVDCRQFVPSGKRTWAAKLCTRDDGVDRKAATEAEEFLRDKLSKGPIPAKEGEAQAQALGIAPRTLKRARKKLGVIAEKSGMQEGWVWFSASEINLTARPGLRPA